MQKTFFILFLFVLVKFCQGQQNENDSLLAALKLHPEEDTIRFSLLNDLAFNYQFSDPDQGIKMADEAIALSKKINNNKALAGAYSSKAMNLLAKGEDSLALDLYTSAMEVHKRMNNEPGIARIYNNMAIVYVNRSEYAKALDCHTNSFAIFKKLNDSARMAGSLTNRGVVYQYLSDYPQSLNLYFQALSLYEKLGKTNDIANTLTNIGIIYKNLDKYPLSLEYHTKALAIYDKSVNLQGKANVLGNIGVTYDSWNNPLKALEFYQQALTINRGIGNKNRIGSDLTNIGKAYKELKDYSQAIIYLNKAIDNYKQTEDKNSLAIALNILGDVLLNSTDQDLKKAGIAPKDRFAKALALQQESLQLAINIEAPDRQASTWHSLSGTYEAKGEYRKALDAFKKSKSLQDSIFSDEKAAEIARKELQFKYDKDLAVLKAQHNGEIKQQQIIRRNMTGWGLGALLAGAVIFIFYKKRRDAVQQKNEAEFKTRVADTEMKVLRLQMNPHFIFNSLNSISDFISKNDIQSADSYLSKFAKVMRMTLENSEKKTVTLGEDLKNLELYIQLEAQRLNNKFTYEIKVASDIDQDNTLVPPMIFQPFVENSVWHGMTKKEEQGHITINIRKEGEMIHCMIDDNGIGRQLQEEIAGEIKTSLGMKITKARIEILNQLKGSNATVQLIDKPQGVRAELNLPLQLNF